MGDLDKTITDMMKYICDNLCKYPEMESEEQVLVDICGDCRMGKFVRDILKQQNKRRERA